MKFHLPLFLIFACFLSEFTHTQSGVGFTAGPGLTFRSYEQPCADQPVRYDSQPVGFQFGAYYLRTISPRFQLSAGLQYARRAFSYYSSDLRWGSQHDGAGGFDPCLPSGEPDLDDLKATEDFAGLSLGARYAFGQRAVRPFVGVGLLPSLRHHFSPVRSNLHLHCFARLATGFTAVLSPDLNLVAQLVAEYDFIKLDPSIIEERLYGFTLQLGLEHAL